jgi:hypothetical protein
MTKATHRKIQLLLFALYVPIGGFYYYYYKKNREIDVYRLQLWSELKCHSISKEEYYRLWDPKAEEWKESFRKCELLDIPAVAVFFYSVVSILLCI